MFMQEIESTRKNVPSKNTIDQKISQPKKKAKDNKSFLKVRKCKHSIAKTAMSNLDTAVFEKIKSSSHTKIFAKDVPQSLQKNYTYCYNRCNF